MKRVVILGGSGFFGRLIAERLFNAGLKPIVASRSWGELRIDANNPEDLKKNLKPRDLVIDAAGPFQTRTPALIEGARTMGFDVIDLSDSADYTRMIYEHETPIGASGIRVLTACSALSTVSAAALKSSSVESTRRLSVYLVPANRNTANPGTVASLLASIEGNVRTFDFPKPLGHRGGITVKSVDSVTLPRIFPSLQTTEFVVDVPVFGANFALKIAARWPAFREFMERNRSALLAIGRRVGSRSGVLAYEMASTAGHKYRIFTGEKCYLMAVIPAIEAAIAIVGGRFPHRGLVPPTNHADPAQLFDAVRKEGIATIAG